MPEGSNLKQFKFEMDKGVENVVAEFVQFHRDVAIFAYREIIRLSPVWTGRFRASHTISINDPDETVHPGLPKDELPRWPEKPKREISAPSLGQAQVRLAPLKPFQTVWINNSLPYAGTLENGNSTQAPTGVYNVALTSAEVKFANVK